MDKPFITISIGREFGSGGRILGQIIAERLGYKFYDNELLTLAAKEIGFSQEIFEEKDEQPVSNTFFNNIQQLLGGGNENYLSDANIFKIQSDVIKKISQSCSCVIMGRCSDYVLRDNPYMISFFFSSNLNDRVKRVCERFAIDDPEKAERMILIKDKRRSEYYNYFTGKIWGKATSYNVCIDVSLLGSERTADFIIDLLKAKFGNLIPQ